MEQSRLVARERVCVCIEGTLLSLCCPVSFTVLRAAHLRDVGGVEHRCLSLSHNFSAFIFSSVLHIFPYRDF